MTSWPNLKIWANGGKISKFQNDRQQYINIDQIKTDSKPIQCGVPQGSILGPLLFLIYVNDLYNSSKVMKFIMFTDDTNIFLYIMI